MLYPLLKELLISKDLKLEEGSVKFFDQRMQLMLSSYFAHRLHDAKDFWKEALLQYESMKMANSEGWFKTAIEKRGLKGNALIEWAVKYFNLAGWGVYIFEESQLTYSKARFIARIENCALANVYLKLYGKSKYPICHIYRGGIGGGFNAVVGRTDCDVIETQCTAQGYGHCILLGKPRDEFEDTKREDHRKQLHLK